MNKGRMSRGVSEMNKLTCGLTWNCCMVGYAIAWGIALLGVAAGVNCVGVCGTQAAPGNCIDAPILSIKVNHQLWHFNTFIMNAEVFIAYPI